MKLTILILVLFIQNSFSHGGLDHSKEKTVAHPGSSKINQKINTSYTKNVRSIFVRTCFDCHSSDTKYPWYYKVPVIKQLMDSDIFEAKKHLDFTNGFPFIGHESPLKDLQAIRKVLIDKSMPPFEYRLLHSNSKITEAELTEIKNWIEKSIQILEIK